MSGPSDWEAFIRGRIPGYLLPDSAASSLTVEQARRFLEAISGRPDQLELLRATSLFTPRVAALKAFVSDALVDLVRNLPSCTERRRREWEGGFQGRLAVAETHAVHMAGRRTTFITQSRRRSFELPENVFLRAVCERLLAVLVHLRVAKAMPDTGWGEGTRECEGTLRRLIASTALREVPIAQPSVGDENAARAARHDAYRQAVSWAGWMTEALDAQDPECIARVVKDGALLPLADCTRFELAVVIRLAEALTEAFNARQPGRWRLERALVLRGRKDVFALVSDTGVAVKIFYNQAVLPAGAADLGGAHYLGNTGRLRPDVTLMLERDGRPQGAFVVECKLSDDPSYVLSGYHEAILYRWEYSEHLFRWPKAILVASSAVPGSVRHDDEVVACSWAAWPARGVVDAIVGYACDGVA